MTTEFFRVLLEPIARENARALLTSDERPILKGLVSLPVLQAGCDRPLGAERPSRLKNFFERFSAKMIPSCSAPFWVPLWVRQVDHEAVLAGFDAPR